MGITKWTVLAGAKASLRMEQGQWQNRDMSKIAAALRFGLIDVGRCLTEVLLKQSSACCGGRQRERRLN